MDKKIQVPEKIKKELVVPVAKSGPQVQALVNSGDRTKLIDANVKRMAPLLNALREYDSKD